MENKTLSISKLDVNTVFVFKKKTKDVGFTTDPMTITIITISHPDFRK